MRHDAELDLIPLSALQHVLYCPRQCALIHVEQMWEENRFTAEGRLLHEATADPKHEVRRGVRVATAMPLASRALGVSGIADLVELHPLEPPGRVPPRPDQPRRDSPPPCGEGLGVGGIPTDVGTTPLPDPSFQGESERGAERFRQLESMAKNQAPDEGGAPHRRPKWLPFPVEYKRGKPKIHRADEVQLCAQAICLEEMFGVAVPEGALFYGETRRRMDVAFDAELRALTAEAARQARALVEDGRTPDPVYEKRRCDSCSLFDLCRPRRLERKGAVAAWIARRIEDS